MGRSYVFKSSALLETQVGDSKQEKLFFFLYYCWFENEIYAPLKTVIRSHMKWTLLKVVAHITLRRTLDSCTTAQSGWIKTVPNCETERKNEASTQGNTDKVDRKRGQRVKQREHAH